MLGTPNFGSFMPALALCMQDSLINRVISLDETQSITALIKKVFSSFPSWYQMLPSHSAGHFEEYDLFESENWPKKIPYLNKRLLEAGRRFQEGLPLEDARFRVMWDWVLRTITGVIPGNEKSFCFTTTNDGDGVVPLTLAKLSEKYSPPGLSKSATKN